MTYEENMQQAGTLLPTKISSSDGKIQDNLRKRNSQLSFENGRKSQLNDEDEAEDEDAEINQSLVTSSPKITVV